MYDNFLSTYKALIYNVLLNTYKTLIFDITSDIRKALIVNIRCSPKYLQVINMRYSLRTLNTLLRAVPPSTYKIIDNEDTFLGIYNFKDGEYGSGGRFSKEFKVP